MKLIQPRITRASLLKKGEIFEYEGRTFIVNERSYLTASRLVIRVHTPCSDIPTSMFLSASSQVKVIGYWPMRLHVLAAEVMEGDILTQINANKVVICVERGIFNTINFKVKHPSGRYGLLSCHAYKLVEVKRYLCPEDMGNFPKIEKFPMSVPDEEEI